MQTGLKKASIAFFDYAGNYLELIKNWNIIMEKPITVRESVCNASF